MPDVDLLADLDAVDTCWCGRSHEECEDAGGCRWIRELAEARRTERAKVAEEVETHASRYVPDANAETRGYCDGLQRAVKIARGDSDAQ